MTRRKREKKNKLLPSVSNTKDEDNIDKIAVRPKNAGQQELIDAIDSSTFIFAIGAAGTGKSYIAMKMGVKYLLEKKVSRLVLIRPAVTASENLGYLPGSLQEKLDPYLIPLYEILKQHIHYADVKELFDSGKIETSAIAYMRGRTLDNCFVIVDEAQNTIKEQVMMIMTRIGRDSKMIFDGDIDQIDVKKEKSGLLDAVKRFDIDHKEFKTVELTEIVRNPLISVVINQYKKEIKE